VCAAIERSTACRAAAARLRADLRPLLAVIYRHACPEPEQLVAFQEARLEGTQALVIQRHLDSCPPCQHELAALHTLDTLLTAAQPDLPTRVAGLVRRVVEATFQPALAAQVLGSDVLAYRSPSIYLSLSTEKAPGQARTWSLWGEARTLDGQLLPADQIEAVLLHPVAATAAPDELAADLDADGSFVFEGLAAGSYRLRLLTTDEEIIVRAIPVGDPPA
jgi:hypothetical protein